MKILRPFLCLALAATIALCLASPVLAADAKSTPTPAKTDAQKTEAALSTAGGVQSYAAESALQDGTIVQLKDAKTNTVGVSTKAELANMYGVTVDRQQLSVSVSSGSLKNEVYVATSGTYDVLVSTQNGSIAPGDYITLSAVNGVAMKATEDAQAVFGRAAAKFDGKSDTLGKVSLKDTDGKDGGTVAIGKIAVSIDVKRNPIEKSTKANLPETLQRVGEAIAEKPVGPVRILLSVVILAITMVAAGTVLYSGIRNGLISIGRNPLSKKGVMKGMVSVILSGIVIMIIGVFAVYLLLKL